MKISRSALPNFWKLVTVYTCALLAVGLAMLVFSPAQASQAIGITRPIGNSNIASLISTPVITIGVGAVLSGPYAASGWSEANAVQLAISQTNAAGGVNVGGVTYTLALVMADDAIMSGDTAATTLINAGAVAVVGYDWSGATFAAEPIHNAAGVPMISVSGTAPDLTHQGYNVVFRTIMHDAAPAILLATYFHNGQHFSKSAIVESSNFTQTTDFYQNTFTALGGTITNRHTINSTSLFTATLTAIQAENPDVIANLYYDFMDPNMAATAGLFSKVAYNLGMTNTPIGWSWGTADESVLATYANAAGTAASEGDYAAMAGRRTQDMPGYPAFLADYQAAGFPNSPTDPSLNGPYAYDAARIIIAAIVRAGSTNPTAIRNAIATTQNFQGVLGTYQGFDSYGDVIPQWAWLERYRNGQWVILNPSQLFLPLILK